MLSNEKRIEIRQFAIDWNNKFPLDFWYRRRYNIRFNSKKHRSVNLIDVLIEFEEVLVIQEYRERGIKVENDLFLQETTGRWQIGRASCRERV